MAGRRIEVGFAGGTVLRVTVEESEAQALVTALPDGDGWRNVDAEEGSYWVNVGEAVYVRLVPGEVPARIGFGGVGS
jgi:hypothetical protein